MHLRHLPILNRTSPPLEEERLSEDRQMEIEEGNSSKYSAMTPVAPVTPTKSNLVANGTVDCYGRTADKTRTGGWKASPFIIVNEVAERMAFYAIAVGMVTYLVREMHQSLPDAATHVTDWIGAAFILTVLGAFLADAYLGRFKTIVIFTAIYALGMLLLTLSASLDGLRPPPGKPATARQTAFLYGALSLIALGTGGIKPCVSSFGADQFDEADGGEVQKKYSFFNWFFFAINMGVLLGITLMVYVQVRKGWGWGFGVPAAATVVSLLVLVAGAPVYRYQKPMGSPFTRFVQVVVAACRNHMKGVSRENLYEVRTEESDIVGAKKLRHTKQYRFLDNAAVVTDQHDDADGGTRAASRWRLCTVTQVEELKCFIRVLPIWASTISLSISFAQMSTFFISQAALMDRKLAPHFVIPPGSVPVVAAINPLLLVPLYEAVAVPVLRRLTGHRRGLSSLQRMGVGLFVSVFALASAALVEKRRRESASVVGAGAKHPMTFFWLVPQLFLMGTAEVFAYVGQLEFFYDEATDGTRSLCSAMFLTEFGIGSWLSTALVKVVGAATGGQGEGWLRNDLNASRLDYFYWILCGVNAASFVAFVLVAMAYKGKDGTAGRVMDEDEAYDHQKEVI